MTAPTLYKSSSASAISRAVSLVSEGECSWDDVAWFSGEVYGLFRPARNHRILRSTSSQLVVIKLQMTAERGELALTARRWPGNAEEARTVPVQASFEKPVGFLLQGAGVVFSCGPTSPGPLLRDCSIALSL